MARPRKRSIRIELTGLSEPHAARLHHSIEALLRGAVPGSFVVSSNVDAKDITEQAFNGTASAAAKSPRKAAPRAKKAPAKRVGTAKKSPARVTSARKARPTTRPAKKAAPVKKVSGVKKASVRKAAVRKAPVRKAPVKKAPVRKAPAKRVATAKRAGRRG